MRITIDVSAVVYGTGVSVYTKNLVRNLLSIDKKNEYLLFGGSLRRGGDIRHFFDTLNDLHNFEGRVFLVPPTLADFVWNRLHLLSIERFIGKTDVFHTSDWTEPPAKSFKVTTIHDLAPILYPHLSHPRIVSAHKARLRWVVKESDRVIVPSKTTAYDVEKLGVRSEKIRLIPEAPDSSLTRASTASIEAVKIKYGIKGDYLLAVGVNERKNTARIIEAYKKLKTNIDLKLVALGYAFSRFEKVPGVIFTGHAHDADLAALYSGAEALVYPSRYEGFGLPILEAFVCGTPVVTSKIGSMAEVGREAAILVDPENVESIVLGIEEALNKREKLIKLGTREVSKYSWKTAAEMTLAVYEEAS